MKLFFFCFLSDGDVRADAPRWWIIDYMNNCRNYSVGTMIARDTLLIPGGGVAECDLVSDRKRMRVAGVLEVPLMGAAGFWWVEMVGSAVWPIWEAALPQGEKKKEQKEIFWSGADVWHSDFSLFALHLLYTTNLTFAFCSRLIVSSYQAP